jgi:hypothetical protein
MKYLILFLLSTCVFANHIPQQFYRAHAGKNLVEGGWLMNTETSKLDVSGAKSVKEGTTDFSLSFQRGINEDMAIGLKVNERTSGPTQALTDHEIFFEGSYKDFFYGLSLFLDGGEYEMNENFSRGAMTYNVTLGYFFKKHYGFRIDYTPGWTGKVNGSDDVDYDAIMDLKFFYERTLGKNTLGASIGQLTSNGLSDIDTDDTTWTNIRLYTVIPAGTLDITAALQYNMGEQKDYSEKTQEGLEIGARYQF